MQLNKSLWPLRNTPFLILMESQFIINVVEPQDKLYMPNSRLQEINGRVQENLKILKYLWKS